jgi:hypothetical protein
MEPPFHVILFSQMLHILLNSKMLKNYVPKFSKLIEIVIV